MEHNDVFHYNVNLENQKMSSQIKSGFVTPDGKVFATAAEARDYLRKPLVEKALKGVAGGDANLTKFLQENEDEIQKAFEVGTVSRVTKSERNKLTKALDYICEAMKLDAKAKFVTDNAAAIKESFRWPAVKRMNDEEKTAATKEMLTKLADENAANWIIKNKDAILNAYQAGVEKRAPPANSGLAEYQAAKAAGPEALAAYNAKREAAKQAAAAAKKS